MANTTKVGQTIIRFSIDERFFSQEAKALLGKEVLADTRAETKRRQASANAKKPVAKATPTRKPALKRLGTMAKTATVSSLVLIEMSRSVFVFRKEKRTLNELERNRHENVRVVDRRKAANRFLMIFSNIFLPFIYCLVWFLS